MGGEPELAGLTQVRSGCKKRRDKVTCGADENPTCRRMPGVDLRISRQGGGGEHTAEVRAAGGGNRSCSGGGSDLSNNSGYGGGE